MRKGFVISLVVLVLLIVGADRIGLLVAQKEIAKNVAKQADLDHEPKVKIKGFPFLTQAISGDYKEIDVGMGDFTRDGTTFRDTVVALKGLHAPLTEVVQGQTSDISADTATATATVGYEVIRKNAPEGMRVSSTSEGLKVRGKMTVLGQSMPVTAIVNVKAVDGHIRVVPKKIESSGVDVPSSVAQEMFSFTVPVRGLPLNSRITDIEVLRDGLRISTSAEDVKMSDLDVN